MTQEPLVNILQKGLLFGCEFAMMLIDKKNTFEQVLVLHDAVGMFCKQWTQFLCQCIHLIICVCTYQIEEDGGGCVQQLAGAGLYGVLEGWLLWIVNDSLYGFILQSHTFQSLDRKSVV